MSAILLVLLAALPVAAIAAGLVIFLRRPAAAAPASDGGKAVRLVAAFGSIRGAGPFGGSHNNFNPLLVLYDDRIEYRVLKRTEAPYANITAVDAKIGWRSASVMLTFTDSAFTFTGNTGDKAALAKVLRFFRDKGCPLSDAAKTLAGAPEA